jgi:hypothetical protein
MSKEKKHTGASEKLLKTVTEQLVTSLAALKAQVGEKKFNKRIKKAAKLLVAGVEKKPVKKVIPKPVKAAIPKKTKSKPAVKKAAKTISKKAK